MQHGWIHDSAGNILTPILYQLSHDITKGQNSHACSNQWFALETLKMGIHLALSMG